MFSSAIKLKDGLLDNMGHPGVITEQWFTGGNAIISMVLWTRAQGYDKENDVSLDLRLFLAHGIGCSESDKAQNIP